MNPALLMQLIGIAQSSIQAIPALMAEYEAIKQAGKATPEELGQLKAAIDAMDAARRASFAEADDALTRAEQRG